MNKILIEVALPDKIDMARARDIGAMLASAVREQVATLITSQKLELGEVFVGDPGYVTVLGMANIKAQNKSQNSKGHHVHPKRGLRP